MKGPEWYISCYFAIYLARGQAYKKGNNNPECYGIIAGEVTDQFSNKENLLFCLRFAYTFQNELPSIHETFFDSFHIDDCPNCQTIGNSILSLLEKNETDIVKCRPQAHE